MSVVIFVGQEKPEKRLKNTLKYKAYLSKEQQEEIIEQIVKSLKAPIENYIISMYVEIELKEYDT